jgi:hypothetical protein
MLHGIISELVFLAATLCVLSARPRLGLFVVQHLARRLLDVPERACLVLFVPDRFACRLFCVSEFTRLERPQ